MWIFTKDWWFLSFRNVSSPVKGRATNNAGEIQGATRAIWDCSDEGIDNLVINTDSDFLRVSVEERLWRWRQNGFRKVNGEPLANQRDFIELNKALKKNSQMYVEFQHCSAHSGNEYNDAADQLAKRGARQYCCWIHIKQYPFIEDMHISLLNIRHNYISARFFYDITVIFSTYVTFFDDVIKHELSTVIKLLHVNHWIERKWNAFYFNFRSWLLQSKDFIDSWRITLNGKCVWHLRYLFWPTFFAFRWDNM